MKTYDPTEVAVVVGGSLLKSWNTVSVVMDEDGWSFTTGTQGESTRTKNANKMGAITITLPQGSGDNAILSAYMIAGAVLTCSVIDKSGASIHIMPKGTVIKLPDAEYGKEAGEREWTVKGDIPETSVIGGNTEA